MFENPRQGTRHFGQSGSFSQLQTGILTRLKCPFYAKNTKCIRASVSLAKGRDDETEYCDITGHVTQVSVVHINVF